MVHERETRVECLTGEGVGAGLLWEATIETLASTNGTAASSYRPPSLTAPPTVIATAVDAPKAQWRLTLRIKGRDFGPSEATGSVAVSGEPCVATRWTHEVLECTVHASAADERRSRSVVVLVAGQRSAGTSALAWQCAPGCELAMVENGACDDGTGRNDPENAEALLCNVPTCRFDGLECNDPCEGAAPVQLNASREVYENDRGAAVGAPIVPLCHGVGNAELHLHPMELASHTLAQGWAAVVMQ